MVNFHKIDWEGVSGRLCRAMLLLTGFAAGGSVSRIYFGLAENIRLAGLDEPAVILCGFFGAFAAPVFLRLTRMNRLSQPLAGILASSVMLAAPGLNRLMLAFPETALPGTPLIAAAAGFAVMLLVFTARAHKAVRNFYMAAALGGLLNFACCELISFPPGDCRRLFAFCCLLAFIPSVLLLGVMLGKFSRAAHLILPGTIAVAIALAAGAGALWVFLFSPFVSPGNDLIYTSDGYRRRQADDSGVVSFYTLDGKKTAVLPRDLELATALLPATLQTPNHNLQVLLAASPLSQLIPEALRTHRIAGVDHLTGDPELAAVNQSHMITRAAVRRIGRFALLDGPYDLIVAAEGDPIQFIPLLTGGGVLAVPSDLSAAVPDGTFRYSGVVPGAQGLTLYSNRPITTSWDKLEETFGLYDGIIRKFPAGVLSALYKLNQDRDMPFEGLSGIELRPRPEAPPQVKLRRLFEIHPAITMFLGALAVLLFFWRISAEGRRYSSEFRRYLLSGLTVSGCVLASLGAIEAIGGTLELHGYALLFPAAGPLFFPNGLSSDGVIRRMAAPVAAFLAVYTGMHPAAGMVGAFIFGCLNTTREKFRSCAVGFSGEIASGAGALIGIASAMLLMHLPAGWIIWLIFFTILF